jgi:hypothetical protein
LQHDQTTGGGKSNEIHGPPARLMETAALVVQPNLLLTRDDIWPYGSATCSWSF